MGGGDLNMKKSWHPLLRVNQERVWKQEKKAYEERKKLDELRRERDQERQMQELQRLQEEAGGQKKQDKVDWMYATPATSNGPNASELEDYLLGKKRVDQFIDQKTKRVNQEAISGSNNGIDSVSTTTMNPQDLAAKIREDPMFAIKQREQQAYQALLKDPTRLHQMRIAAGLESPKDEGRKRRRRDEDERRSRRTRDETDEERRERREHSERRRRDGKDDERSERRWREGRGEYTEGRRREDRDEYSERRRREDRDLGDPHRRGRDARDDRDNDRRRRDDRDADYNDRGSRDTRASSSYARDQDRRREYSGSTRNNDDRRRDDRDRYPASSGTSATDRYTNTPPHDRQNSASSRPNRPPPMRKDGPSDAEAERAARLARMQSNARDMNADRDALIAKAKEEERLEQIQEDRARQRMERMSQNGKASFMLDQQRTNGDADLEDRLKRAKRGLQRIGGDEE